MFSVEKDSSQHRGTQKDTTSPERNVLSKVHTFHISKRLQAAIIMSSFGRNSYKAGMLPLV